MNLSRQPLVNRSVGSINLNPLCKKEELSTKVFETCDKMHSRDSS